MDINLKFSGANIFDASQRMEESMASSMFIPVDTSEQVKSMARYYPTYAVNTIVPGSSGNGRMKIVASNNIVGCNKASKSIADSSKFPFNMSDCAISIGLGTAYAKNSVIFGWAWRSYYCFLEAMQSGLAKMGENTGSNVYCNGKYKSGHIIALGLLE